MLKLLECAFKRAPPLIACCMRLHNWCLDDANLGIEGAMEPEMNPGDGCVQIHQQLISFRPRFDRDGLPVDMLSNIPLPCSTVENVNKRNHFVELMKGSGQLRPGLGN